MSMFSRQASEMALEKEHDMAREEAKVAAANLARQSLQILSKYVHYHLIYPEIMPKPVLTLPLVRIRSEKLRRWCM